MTTPVPGISAVVALAGSPGGTVSSGGVGFGSSPPDNGSTLVLSRFCSAMLAPSAPLACVCTSATGSALCRVVHHPDSHRPILAARSDSVHRQIPADGKHLAFVP